MSRVEAARLAARLRAQSVRDQVVKRRPRRVVDIARRADHSSAVVAVHERVTSFAARSGQQLTAIAHERECMSIGEDGLNVSFDRLHALVTEDTDEILSDHDRVKLLGRVEIANEP